MYFDEDELGMVSLEYPRGVRPSRNSQGGAGLAARIGIAPRTLKALSFFVDYEAWPFRIPLHFCPVRLLTFQDLPSLYPPSESVELPFQEVLNFPFS